MIFTMSVVFRPDMTHQSSASEATTASELTSVMRMFVTSTWGANRTSASILNAAVDSDGSRNTLAKLPGW